MYPFIYLRNWHCLCYYVDVFLFYPIVRVPWIGVPDFIFVGFGELNIVVEKDVVLIWLSILLIIRINPENSRQPLLWYLNRPELLVRNVDFRLSRSASQCDHYDSSNNYQQYCYPVLHFVEISTHINHLGRFTVLFVHEGISFLLQHSLLILNWIINNYINQINRDHIIDKSKVNDHKYDSVYLLNKILLYCHIKSPVWPGNIGFGNGRPSLCYANTEIYHFWIHEHISFVI